MHDGDPEGGAQSDGDAASRRRLLPGLLGWFGRHRRLLIVVLGLMLFFYVVGRFASPVTTSGMCLVYG